jgi:hypothetical protein
MIFLKDTQLKRGFLPSPVHQEIHPAMGIFVWKVSWAEVEVQVSVSTGW